MGTSAGGERVRGASTRGFGLALVLAMSASAPALAHADAASVEAAVSSDTMAIDETLRLVVTVNRDVSQSYQGYSRPDMHDFDVVSQAESEQTQWMFTNGVQTTRTIEQHVYLLRPKKKGTLAIPPATANVGGKELRSRELSVKVTAPQKKMAGLDPSGPNAANAGAGQQNVFGIPGMGTIVLGGSGPQLSSQGPDGMRGDEDLFIEARADKTTVHVGEQVVVSWRLYTKSDLLRSRPVAEPKHDDFWSEDLFVSQGKLAWERAMVKGQEYQSVLLLEKALFPLRSGKLTVTPLEVEATTMQTAFYAGGSAARASKALTIEVLPLPAVGRPDGFETPDVGHFEVSATVDRDHVQAGEAVTYKLVVKGRGNMRNLKLSKTERLDGRSDGRMDAFKVYEPAVEDAIERDGSGVFGTKTWKYLLLPKVGGQLSIPPVELSYFDPDGKKYERSVAPAFTITVAGDPEKIGAAQAETKENVLGPRIRPLRNSHHVETRLGDEVLRGRGLWAAIAAPPSLLLCVVVGNLVLASLRRETAGSKRRRARAAARKRLRTCELHIKGQRPSAFFAECVRAIYEHLEYRLGMKTEAFTIEELRRVLRERGFDEQLASSVAGELESCDFARFAPSASGPGEMRSAMRRVRTLLTQIEKARLLTGGVAEVAA